MECQLLGRRSALKIPESALAFTWRYISKTRKIELEEGVQIDLVFDRKDGIVNICEIKYSQQDFKLDKNLIAELERKATIYKKITQTPKQVFVSLITSHSIRPSAYQHLIHSTACLEDFFKPVYPPSQIRERLVYRLAESIFEESFNSLYLIISNRSFTMLFKAT